MPTRTTKSTKSNNNSSKTISVSKPVSNPITGPSPNTNSFPTYQPPSMIDNIKAGFGLGVGSSIGARITDSIFGNRRVEVINKTEPTPTNLQVQTPTSTNNECYNIMDEYRFNNCIMDRNNDKCNELYNKFNSCQKKYIN
jgi:hypothetical protein